MSESAIKIGHPVPNFELNVFFPDKPIKEAFGKINLEQLKRDKKWTILFFYPADFTFV